MKKYIIEREGQIDFFNNFRIDYNNEPVLIDYTDGVYNGCLLEFKLEISNSSKVLSQAIKYLSKMRVKGESVPATILLISLNTSTCYVYKSEDYFGDIHKLYFGSASKDNELFVADNCNQILNYSNDSDAVTLLHILKDEKTIEEKYIPIEIDEDCIVGWAERYYRENPKASKGDFIGSNDGLIPIVGEIREPMKFKGLIKPYKKQTNEKFKYLMDKLNDKLHKKDLGAFYTPIPYCKKAAELLDEAIAKVPKGNDYIILDRSAGTGNLESILSDEVLSHCILSTYEYYEYKVLLERLGDKVLAIIPPTESNVKYSSGYVLNADALSKQYIENELIKEYINNPKYTIILYENPPYSEASTAQANQLDKSFRSSWKNSYVISECSDELPGVSKNELANLFIWSAFKYYLRQDTDSYVLFSPIKFWKSQHIMNKKFERGFVFNKKHFHASPSSIVCGLWSNIESNQEQIELDAFDIVDEKIVQLDNKITIKKVWHLLSEDYDKRKIEGETGIVCEKNGYPASKGRTSISIKPVYSEDIIAYLISKSFSFENPRLSTTITRVAIYDGHGFYVRKDNYLKKLPLFVAGKYPVEEKWYENGIIYKSFDGGNEFEKDNEFLKQCLIFTCLSYYNKCLSFDNPYDHDYINELCFDSNTIASKDIKKFNLTNVENQLLDLWNKILIEAKKTANYNPKYKYGIYQITMELNTYRRDEETNENIYDYPQLNGYINSLKMLLNSYYKEFIAPNLFKYQLLK